ncbi:sporulation integral membrane protein YtvI [Natranaerovirga hydrolytica]|uniref:Sporulation integral membrane protein YtvI n=1 Tax=Natranaerovirga hydrolytica TaxID=680378 RepID=A0A4R1MTI1_9FIRM|nr:sporulation integral membrane protein YtvI [Natranaerovirga hydrolytica]TCK93273.1 sporulation integral membrane protein YtvI [Natranaerovirga hydrolytica]
MTDKNYKTLINFLIVGAILLFVYYFTVRLISLFLPFIVGYVIAIIIEPFIKLMNKYVPLPRAISSFISVIAFFAVVGTLGHFIIRKLLNELKILANNIPEYRVGMTTALENLGYRLDNILGNVEGSTRSLIVDNWDQIGESLTSLLTPGVTGGSINFVSSVPGFLFFLVITLIATYFISKDRYKIRTFIIKQLPKKWKDKFNLIRKELLGAFWGYVKAQLTLMVIIGVVCTIGLLILRHPYALLIGLAITVLDALPIFGSGTVLIPWALFEAFSGNLQYALWLGIIYGVSVLIRQFLEPKLIGDNIGINPLATLIAIYVGLKVFGVMGIIIGPLILIFIKTMQEVDVLPKWRE